MKNLIIPRITLIAALALITPLIASCSSKSKIEGTCAEDFASAGVK